MLTLLLAAALCQFAAGVSNAQDIDSIAPVVVKTVPEAGLKDVAPGEVEIKVTFSKEMKDGSWSWTQAAKDTFPEIIGKPKYLEDKRTCVLDVNLEPKKTYVIWVNSQKFAGFKDTDGNPSVPYLLIFQTK